jgi:hypothetical protein
MRSSRSSLLLPYPNNYVSIIKAWYAENLKDPDSAKFNKISKPQKEHAIENQFQRLALFGYSVCATVNAKNSFGGYTGSKVRWFLIRNGVVVREQPADEHIYLGHYPNCGDGA